MKDIDKLKIEKVAQRQRTNYNLRGHTEKLDHRTCTTTMKLKTFGNRIVNSWNNLPQGIIDSQSVNEFKNGIDKHLNKEMYEYRAIEIDSRKQQRVQCRGRRPEPEREKPVAETNP